MHYRSQKGEYRHPLKFEASRGDGQIDKGVPRVSLRHYNEMYGFALRSYYGVGGFLQLAKNALSYL